MPRHKKHRRVTKKVVVISGRNMKVTRRKLPRG